VCGSVSFIIYWYDDGTLAGVIFEENVSIDGVLYNERTLVIWDQNGTFLGEREYSWQTRE
jgi:hypothetical protein